MYNKRKQQLGLRVKKYTLLFLFQGATFEKAGFDTAETKLIKSNRIDEYIFQFWDSKK